MKTTKFLHYFVIVDPPDSDAFVAFDTSDSRKSRKCYQAIKGSGKAVRILSRWVANQKDVERIRSSYAKARSLAHRASISVGTG